MKQNHQLKRFFSVRLTPAEFEEVQRHFRSSACHSLTEYGKKLLTNKPVTIKIRNASIDEWREELFRIRTLLQRIEDRSDEKIDQELRQDIAEMKILLRQLYARCSLG